MDDEAEGHNGNYEFFTRLASSSRLLALISENVLRVGASTM